MKQNSTRNSLALQAGILAVAGIITRIIGLLYRSPLTAVIGTQGLGYYQSAYSYYTLVLLISSYSIPSAISKVMSGKLAKGEYKNAHRMFKCALGYVFVVGLIGSLVLFFGAGALTTAEAVPVLRVFAPTIFLYGALGVLRGYFQAHKSMTQTAISQILEQIVNAVVSVGMAVVLINSAFGTLERPSGEADMVLRSVRGAQGSALGTGAGVLAALIIVLVFYIREQKSYKLQMDSDTTETVDSVGSIIKTITAVVFPFILSTAIYNLSEPVNNYIYTKIICYLKGISSTANFEGYGIYSGIALVITNIPIAFATAMAAALIPSISQLFEVKDIEGAKEKVASGVRITMFIAIPSAVGLGVLATPFCALLFPSESMETLETAGALLMTLAISVVFFSLSTISNSVLQGVGKVKTPIKTALYAWAIQTAVLMALLMYTNLDLYSMAIANSLYPGLTALFNARELYKAIGYKQEFKKSFLKPFVASAVMGVVVFAVYKAFMLITHSMRISAIPALVAGVLVYFVLIFKIKGIDEEDLKSIPKGGKLASIARKMHLI